MKGYLHEVSPEGGVVTICNNGDEFYWCEFQTRQEIDEFIQKLKQARDEVFGEKRA